MILFSHLASIGSGNPVTTLFCFAELIMGGICCYTAGLSAIQTHLQQSTVADWRVTIIRMKLLHESKDGIFDIQYLKTYHCSVTTSVSAGITGSTKRQSRDKKTMLAVILITHF